MCKKILSILLAAAGLLSLTACWDHVEISDLLFVAGIGLDVDEAGATYHATVEVIDVAADGGENITAEIVEGDGATLYGAVQNAMLMTGGTMFRNHCSEIVIGDKLARAGINGIVDMILRDPELRKVVNILVAKETTAEAILKQKTVKGDIVSFELAEIHEGNVKSIENSVMSGAYQLHEALLSDCAYFVVPTVYTRQNNGEETLLVEGCAVFTGDRLQGYLDGTQCKLLNMLAGRTRNMAMPIQSTALSRIPAEVEITRSGVSLSPGLREGRLTLHISIAAEATLEYAGPVQADLSEEADRQRAQRGISEELSASIARLIADVQSRYGADIFEFYREYEDHYRSEWAALKQDWSARFRDMEISVTLDTEIKESGLIGNYTPKSARADSGNALP